MNQTNKLKKQDNNLSKKILKWITNPFFQFITISSICLLVLLLFVSQSSVSIFLEKWTTILVNSTLNFLRIKTRMSGNLILLLDGSQIKFQIIQDCTGIYPFVILVSLMAGFPAKFSKKIVGFLYAFIFTFLFNFLRLILLFVIGRYSVKWFEIAHIIIWQLTFVLYIVLYFLWWIQWAKKLSK